MSTYSRKIQFPVMNRFAVGLLMFAVGSLSALAAQNDAASYVNTLIGTQRSAIGYGGTMPFVTTPFGMTSWTAADATEQDQRHVV